MSSERMELPEVPEDIVLNIMVWRDAPDIDCNFQILNHPSVPEECLNELTDVVISTLVKYEIISPMCNA